jgi:hypothetical protein
MFVPLVCYPQGSHLIPLAIEKRGEFFALFDSLDHPAQDTGRLCGESVVKARIGNCERDMYCHGLLLIEVARIIGRCAVIVPQPLAGRADKLHCPYATWAIDRAIRAIVVTRLIPVATLGTFPQCAGFVGFVAGLVNPYWRRVQPSAFFAALHGT